LLGLSAISLRNSTQTEAPSAARANARVFMMIAFVSFMGNHKGRKNRHLMIWLQEMKFPLLGEQETLRSATVLPMISSAWQALQDPDANNLDPRGREIPVERRNPHGPA
jgi:hypothetical protein